MQLKDIARKKKFSVKSMRIRKIASDVLHGRNKPYTTMGIKRLPCSKAGCSNKALTQWQICSDRNLYRPLCAECDIKLNNLVREFMGFPPVNYMPE